MEVVVRSAEEKDLAEVFEVEEECFRDPYPFGLLRSYFVVSGEYFLVAVVSGRVIGYAVGLKRWGSVGHLISLAVRKGFRGKGIGERLLDELLRRFERSGAVHARLEVRRNNVAAQRLYEKMGFQRRFSIKNYYPDGEDCLVMFKNLLGGVVEKKA